MSVYDYIKEKVDSVSTTQYESGRKLEGKTDSVMRTGYCPEIDVPPVFNDDQEKYYKAFIGVSRRDIELGCIDKHVKNTLISCYLAQPQ